MGDINQVRPTHTYRNYDRVWVEHADELTWRKGEIIGTSSPGKYIVHSDSGKSQKDVDGFRLMFIHNSKLHSVSPYNKQPWTEKMEKDLLTEQQIRSMVQEATRCCVKEKSFNFAQDVGFNNMVLGI